MKKIIKCLEKVNSLTYLVQRGILLIAVIAMVSINFIQVLCRYVFKYSIPWSEQSSVLLFMMMILLGGNLAMKEDGEIKIEIIKFKDAKKDILHCLLTDIIALVTLVILLISSILITQQSYKHPQVLSALPLKYYHLYTIMIVGFSLMILEKFTKLLQKAMRVVENDYKRIEEVDE